MIDVKDLRENPEKYRRGAELKNISVDIAGILELDAQRLASQQEFERLRSEQNKASQEIGRIKDAEQKKAAVSRMGEMKGQVKTAEERAKYFESKLMPLLLQVPQVPDEDVPVGKDAAENVVQRKWGEPRKFEFKPKNHIELGESLGLFDTARGVKLAGSRSYFLVGLGAELQNAVLRFAMDMMTREHGFTAMTVPVLVREEAMRGTGFFPAGKEQAYEIPGGGSGSMTTTRPDGTKETAEIGEKNLYLTGTGEVGLTAFHMDDTLDESELPKKYTTVSTCFRREAGTYGKDTAGIYRIHQFDKCEQVVICKNDFAESRNWHMTMLGYSEQLLQRLGLPYRVIQCCTGDIGVKNAAMYDLETFMPGRVQNWDIETGYGETHSASRLYEFQARRLNLRYKDKDGKVRFCHTLNNTVVASPRILIPILENYQNEDGSVTVPEALRGHMGGRERISSKD